MMIWMMVRAGGHGGGLVVWLVNPFAFDLAVLGRSGWLVRGAGGAGG
jgi:hypothetical protein